MQADLYLDTAFLALADPTRRAILAQLAEGEANVMDLSNPFALTQPAISRHLKVLEDAGLVVSRIDGTKRPRRLAKPGIDAVNAWLNQLTKAFEANYNRLDGLLAEMTATQKQRGKKK